MGFSIIILEFWTNGHVQVWNILCKLFSFYYNNTLLKLWPPVKVPKIAKKNCIINLTNTLKDNIFTVQHGLEFFSVHFETLLGQIVGGFQSQGNCQLVHFFPAVAVAPAWCPCTRIRYFGHSIWASGWRHRGHAVCCAAGHCTLHHLDTWLTLSLCLFE